LGQHILGHVSTPDRSFVAVTPEVFYSDGTFLAVSHRDVDFLKSAALASPRRRARLCFHSSPEDAQQEMLIVMHRDSYVCPHRHLTKVETLGIVEGSCEALLFDSDGHLVEKLSMTPPSQGGAFFYRMPPGQFHSLLFGSEWVVFVETTIGPFTLDASESAPWAPPESEPTAGAAFLATATASLS
jgi:cupin fold WbuC family metalloprotein